MCLSICVHYVTIKGVDGQEFRDLTGGSYTILIEATGIENTDEVAFDTVGPLVIANATGDRIANALGKKRSLNVRFWYSMLSMLCSCMFWESRTAL